MIDVFRTTPVQEEMRRMLKVTEMVLAADPVFAMVLKGKPPVWLAAIEMAKRQAEHDASMEALAKACLPRPRRPAPAPAEVAPIVVALVPCAGCQLL